MGKNNIRLTTEEFIIRAIKIHRYKYDYSKVSYINQKTKVDIICKIHGIFSILPNNHIGKYNKMGCPKCSTRSKSDFKEFVELGKKTHKKYIYPINIFTDKKTKMEIICPIHGIFKQTFQKHINKKQGCPKCSRNVKLTNDEFIERCNIKHNYKYKYSLLKYISAHKKIEIICPKHGIFKQNANSHLRGGGCPKCKNSRGENLLIEYFIKLKIKYIRNKTFDGCVNKSKLFFDFYLPDYNCCVEYDGAQHFKIVERFGGLLAFLENKKRDNIKNVFCEKNNIKLIRFNYKQKNSEIFDYIKNL